MSEQSIFNAASETTIHHNSVEESSESPTAQETQTPSPETLSSPHAHTLEAYKHIPEHLKTQELYVSATSEDHLFDYDIGIEIYLDGLQIEGRPNLFHHDVGDSINTPSAIAQAAEFDLSQYSKENPPNVAFIKPNKDAIGAVAILDLKLQEQEFDKGIVEAINQVDRYGSTAYKRNHDLEKYREKMVLLDNIAFAKDVSTEQKVALFKAVLTSTYPEEFGKAVVQKRNEAYEESRKNAKVTEVLSDTVAVVELNGRFGPEIGYNQGYPIVISRNDKFAKRLVETDSEGKRQVTFSETETYEKYSISLASDSITFNMEALKSKLNTLEKQKAIEQGVDLSKLGTWGGKPTFLGSPDNESTLLSLEEISAEVVDVVKEIQEKQKSVELDIPHNYEYLALFYRTAEEKAALIQKLRENPTFGVEVTDPDLAAELVGNIDPQHLDGDLKTAAIIVAVDHAAPETDKLATVRPDLDAIGSISVLNITKHLNETYGITTFSEIGSIKGVSTDDVFERTNQIAKADQHGRGEWPGRRQVPKPGDIPDIQVYSGIPAGLARLVSNFRTPLEERVELIETWLLTGECAGLEEANEHVQRSYDKAIRETQYSNVVINEDGEISVVQIEDSADFTDAQEFEGTTVAGITSVYSNNRGAVGLGYTQTPIVFAYTDKFLFRDGTIGPKFTLAQYDEGYIDLVAFRDEIRELDPNAGGSKVIIGSDQNKPTSIPPEEWLRIAVKHINQDKIAEVYA